MKQKLGTPKSTHRCYTQIGKYCTILTSVKKIWFWPSTHIIDEASFVKIASNSWQAEVIVRSTHHQTLWTDKNLARNHILQSYFKCGWSRPSIALKLSSKPKWILLDFQNDSYKTQMHMYLPWSSKKMHMNPVVFGPSNTKPCTGMQSCMKMMMMWQACKLIPWWCGKLTTSEPDSRVWLHHIESDLSWACQKYHCTVRCMFDLRQHHGIIFPLHVGASRAG